MNDACTVCQCNIIVADHIKGFLVLIGDSVCRTLIQRLILLVLQVFALVSFKHLVGLFSLLRKRTKHRIQKSLCHIISISVDTFHLRISLCGIHAESQIRRQSPRRCRPRQDIRILPLCLKPYNGRTLFHVLVALSHLLGGKRRSAAGTIGNNLEALVKQTLIPYLL